MGSQIAIPRTRWTHLREYSQEVYDHMNGGSFKQNEDGSYSVALTRIKPDRIANALRRIFYLTLTAAVALIGQQSRSIPQTIQEAVSPKAFAGYLRDPDVKAAFQDLLKEIVAAPKEPEAAPMRSTGRPKPRPVPAAKPKRTSLLREGEMITTKEPLWVPVISLNNIPFPEMRLPE